MQELEWNWATIAKQVGLVLAILISATQLWDWITAPEDELVADVHFGPFRQPPQLNEQFERFAELQDDEKLTELIELENILTDDAEQVTRGALREALWRFSGLLHERLPTSLPYEFRLRGIWYVRIINNSPRSLSQVTIKIPDTRYLTVEREGMDAEDRESQGVILLGNMRPGESVSLISWTDSEASVYQSKQINLTHSEGIGDIVVRAPVGPMGQWFDKYLVPVVITFFWLAVLFVVLKFSIIKSSKPEPVEEDAKKARGSSGDKGSSGTGDL